MTPALCTDRREALGWTKAELARRARIAPTTVRRYEGGGCPALGRWWVNAITQALSDEEGQRRASSTKQEVLL